MEWFKNMNGQDKVDFWGIMTIFGIVALRKLKKVTCHKSEMSFDIAFDNDDDIRDTDEG